MVSRSSQKGKINAFPGYDPILDDEDLEPVTLDLEPVEVEPLEPVVPDAEPIEEEGQ